MNNKLNEVEDLIQDIFSVPDDAVGIAKEWLDLTEIFTTAIATSDDLLIIQAFSNQFEGYQPYLQICYEDDGAMTIESVSNRFLKPPLSIDAQNTMAELGWELSDEKGLPNYFKFLHKEDADAQVVAQLFAKTLRTAYGIAPCEISEIRQGHGFWPSDNEEAV